MCDSPSYDHSVIAVYYTQERRRLSFRFRGVVLPDCLRDLRGNVLCLQLVGVVAHAADCRLSGML